MKKFLNRFPRLKDKIKYFYLYFCLLKNRKAYKVRTEYPLTKISLDNEESFFGYYDKKPQNGHNILFYSSENDTFRLPSADNPLKICIYDINTSKIKVLTKTKSYNWQQGCRAQWIDDERIIYNDFIEGSYKAVVFDIRKNRKEMIFDRPVQDSFKNKFFLSVNYRRLHSLRPDYGYYNLPAMSKEELHSTSDDGIWYTDIDTGKTRLLMSISDTLGIADDFPNDAVHKFNHVMISPNGDKFIFMHRWFLSNRKTDRLFISDLNGNINLLSDYGMVSHCCWDDNDSLTGYMAGPEGIAYYKVDVDGKLFSKRNNSILESYGDGHPTAHDSGFISDTYPDKSRMQHLFNYSAEDNSLEKIGDFFHGLKFRNECRCDLHPRYDKQEKTVFFDSVFSGKRQLYRMDLNK